MKIITLEEHYMDHDLMNEMNKYNVRREMSPEAAEAMQFLMKRAFPGEELFDFDKRLQYMDEKKIDVQILSLSSGPSENTPGEEAVKIHKAGNDITKRHIDEHPDRFYGFASLPMCDPEAAAEELERCVRELGFKGAMLAGRVNGRFFNEEEFFPVFAKAAELDVPIYFHPAMPPMAVQQSNYMSDNYSFIVGSEFATAAYGWHAEAGIQLVRMILSGIFDRLPNLKFISGHWGETIPAFIERMNSILDQEITHLDKPFIEYYKEHVYLTPSGILSSDQLEYLVKVMGADHILYAIDYPYILPEDPYGFLMNANITDEEKELIAHGNAERILHL